MRCLDSIVRPLGLFAGALMLTAAGCEYEKLSSGEVGVSLDAHLSCLDNEGLDPLWEGDLTAHFNLDVNAARTANLKLEHVRVMHAGLGAQLGEWKPVTPLVIPVPSGADVSLPRQAFTWPGEGCSAAATRLEVVVVATFTDLELQKQMVVESSLIHPRAWVNNNCVFPGRETTPCGKCIARNCQFELNYACDLPTSLPDLIASCAEGNSCAVPGTLPVPEHQQEGPYCDCASPQECAACGDGVLASCIDQCAGLCVPGAEPKGHACTHSDAECRCQPALESSGENCSTASVNNGLCCYDDVLDDCMCLNFGCSISEIGCYCQTGHTYDGQASSCEPPNGGHCCMLPTGWSSMDCICGQEPCPWGYAEVERCSAEALECRGRGVDECPTTIR